MHVFADGREWTKTAGANSVRGGDVDGRPDLPAGVMSLQVLGQSDRDLCKRPTPPTTAPSNSKSTDSGALQNSLRIHMARDCAGDSVTAA